MCDPASGDPDVGDPAVGADTSECATPVLQNFKYYEMSRSSLSSSLGSVPG